MDISAGTPGKSLEVQSWRRRARIAYAVLVAATLSTVVSAPSEAFNASANSSFAGTMNYRIATTTLVLPGGDVVSATPPSNAVDAAEANWETFWNIRGLNRVGSSTNVVLYADGNTSQNNGGTGGVVATASSPCGGNNSGCFVRINGTTTTWNTNVSCPTFSNNPRDFVSTVTHEFGHWYGSSHSTDVPSSGRAQIPTMQAASGEASCRRRSIEQDDLNVVLHRAPGTGNIASNLSFEATHAGSSTTNGDLHWRFLPSSNGTGSATRYADATNAWDGSYFIQFNNGSGFGASIYQELFPRGTGVTSVTPFVKVRNRSSVTQTYELAVFEVDQNNQKHSVICSLPPNSAWSQCSGGPFQVNSNHLILQFYLTSQAGNVSIDYFGMNAND